ncbi:MAG TPA: UbiA family prenyltransferase [Burkholderiales bacterium]|nr:UbiA family prenyltransferase [Burkholderiales bacterium]
MNLAVALRLGRVSNLPTVWSNVMTGMALAGVASVDARLPILLVSLSLFYVGGMFLNDAFDHNFDARARPERPIPSGQVSATQVHAFGFGMMGLGLALLAWVGYGFDPMAQWRPVVAGIALAAAIVFYNWHHKNNPLSPFVMGLCRMLVYVAAGYAVSLALPASLWIAAIVLLCYLIGLTYAAKKEHLGTMENFWPLLFLAAPVLYGAWLAIDHPATWILVVALLAWCVFAVRLLRRRKPGDVPRAVISLIAGISLLDAILLAGHGQIAFAALAVAAFVVTLVLQRWITGT